MARYLFPRWSNKVLPIAVVFGILPATTAIIGGLWYYGTDKNFAVGYEPTQPVDYSHKLHAGDLGMDCRYCHSNVERSSVASVPPTQTCMNCHSKVLPNSEKLLPVRESAASDQAIPWVRVHSLPDYVYFDHSAHVSVGVGCESCHGRVDQMPKVHQVEPLTMGWCLDCHRNPGPNMRVPSEITKMGQTELASVANAAGGSPIFPKVNGRTVNPPLSCTGCHR
jgi:hypothetical protein